MIVLKFALVICLFIIGCDAASLVQVDSDQAERTALANIKLVGEEVSESGVYLTLEFTAFHCTSPPRCGDFEYDVKVVDHESDTSTVGYGRGNQGDILTLKTINPLQQPTESYDYSVRVCAHIGGGMELCTDRKVVNRKEGLMQTMENISLTSAKLFWEAPSSVSYFIVSWESDGRRCNGRYKNLPASPKVYDNSYTLTNLFPATMWKVSVSSFSESGDRTFTATKHFTTKGVVFRSVGDTTAIANFWTTTCSESDGSRSYILNVGSKRYTQECTYNHVCVVDVSGLEPLTSYPVTIRSAVGDTILDSLVLATTGDAFPLDVNITDDNVLMWANPYPSENIPKDGLMYEVFCSSGKGQSIERKSPINRAFIPLPQHGVLYNCSFQMVRGNVKAQRVHEYQNWAVSKAVNSSFGLPTDGISYTNGSSVTVQVPQLTQEGVSIRFYEITVSMSPSHTDEIPSDQHGEGACTGQGYTAVKLHRHQVSPDTTVTVGDSTTMNGVYNRPLLRGCSLVIGVTIVDMRGVAVFMDVYDDVFIYTETDIIHDVSPVIYNTSTIVMAVTIGIAAFAVVLIGAIVAIVWKKCHKRRASQKGSRDPEPTIQELMNRERDLVHSQDDTLAERREAYKMRFDSSSKPFSSNTMRIGTNIPKGAVMSL